MGSVAVGGNVIELVEEHVSAFNARDVGRLLAGLSGEVVWQTGSDTFIGLDQVGCLLRDSAGLLPVLEIKSVFADGERAAVEMTERYRHEGQTHEVPIAVFFSFTRELISRVKVFREGSADP
jgi:uncharacterized protein